MPYPSLATFELLHINDVKKRRVSRSTFNGDLIIFMYLNINHFGTFTVPLGSRLIFHQNSKVILDFRRRLSNYQNTQFESSKTEFLGKKKNEFTSTIYFDSPTNLNVDTVRVEFEFMIGTQIRYQDTIRTDDVYYNPFTPRFREDDA